MILPTSLAISTATANVGHKLRRILLLLTLGLAHFFAMAYCEISAAFSDVFFPFRMSPQPEHALWHGLAEVLQFPLVTLGGAAGLGDSPLMMPLAIANSAIWAVAIYALGYWLTRSMGGKRHVVKHPAA